MLWAFAGIAIIVTVTPGAATAMVIRSALRGGWRDGVRTIAGNAIGVVVWGLLSVLGISALVAASEAAFVTLKVVGAAVLVWLGVQALRGRPHAELPDRPAPRPFRSGVVTSLANPEAGRLLRRAVPAVRPRDRAAHDAADDGADRRLRLRLVHDAGRHGQPRAAHLRVPPDSASPPPAVQGGGGRRRAARPDHAAVAARLVSDTGYRMVTEDGQRKREQDFPASEELEGKIFTGEIWDEMR